MASGPSSGAEHDVRRLVGRLYEIVDELESLFPGRSFTPDGHLVGSIGESLAADAFGLCLNPASTEGYDAVSPDGRKVEIKATQGSGVSLSVVDEVIADLLLVLKLERNGSFSVVYNGPAEPAWAASGKPQKNGQRRISLSKLQALGQAQPAEAKVLAERLTRPRPTQGHPSGMSLGGSNNSRSKHSHVQARVPGGSRPGRASSP